MKPAKDLIAFEKDGEEFHYINFDLENCVFSEGITAVIQFFQRDDEGNKIPIRRTGKFDVMDIKADKSNPSKMILVIE